MFDKNLLFEKNKHWQNEKLSTQEFKRSLFTDLTQALNHKPMIYLTGPRRVGKTEIIKQLINFLIQEKAVLPKQILFFDFLPGDKLEKLDEVWNFYLNNVANPQAQIYFFCDEIQYLDRYEVKLKELYDTYPNLKLCITGSLSLSFKRRMEESLAGRYFAFKLGHLSFEEYLSISKSSLLADFIEARNSSDPIFRQGKAKNFNFQFQNFLQFYRYPELVLFSEEKLVKLYLQAILDQSLNQDALNYFNLHKPASLSLLLKYIIAHNGFEISQNKLASDLQVSRNTVKEYLDVLDLLGLIKIIYNTTNPLTQGNRLTKIYTNSSFGLILDQKLDNYGYLAESYVLDRLFENGQSPTFFRDRNKEVDFVLASQKLAIEVKYRTQLPTFTNFTDYLTKNKFKGQLITQFQTISQNSEIEMIPACLY